MGPWVRQIGCYHPVIGWWYIPKLKAMIQTGHHHFLLRTNSTGMCSDREYSLEQPRTRHRAVLLGDSYAMGYGVDCGSRFSDLLEAKYPNFDVMNFGLSGTGTDQQLLIYENIAKPFEADLYVFAPCTIDIIRNELEFMPSLARQPFYTPKPYFTLDEDRLILHNVPVPRTRLSEEDAKKSETSIHRDTSPYVTRIFRALPQWMRESETFDRIALAVRQSYSAYQSESSKSWRLMRAIIKQFIREVNGKPVFVLPMPTYHHFILKLAPTYVARFAELHDPKGNCFVIDVLPYFERLSPENRRKCRLVNDPGSHYSPQGHKVVANAISDALAEYCPNMLD